MERFISFILQRVRTEAEWIDSLGRVVQALTLPAPATSDSPLAFSLNLSAGLAYVNWIRIKVGGVPQLASKSFLLSPPREPWDDFHVISWAHYNDGVYDKLRHRHRCDHCRSAQQQFLKRSRQQLPVLRGADGVGGVFDLY